MRAYLARLIIYHVANLCVAVGKVKLLRALSDNFEESLEVANYFQIQRTIKTVITSLRNHLNKLFTSPSSFSDTLMGFILNQDVLAQLVCNCTLQALVVAGNFRLKSLDDDGS